MKTHLLTGALLLLFSLGESGAQTSITPTRFRTSAQMVLVPVTVTDHNGKTVEGLRPRDFTLLDDGNRQQIVSVNSEDAPCSVGLVLDISGSMRNALNAAKEVTQAFLATANPEDEFLLLTVSTQPDKVSGFTGDAAAVEEAVESTRPGGMTALIDTVYLGLSSKRNATRPRRALLVLSDGIDNHSQFSKSKLMREAVEADVQIYTIILDSGLTGGPASTVPYRPTMVRKPIDQGQDRQWPRMLEELAEKTGGLYFHVRSEAEAKEAAVKTGHALRNEYVIGYTAPESGSNGKWHRVRVKSNIPDVNVYARSGYYSR